MNRVNRYTSQMQWIGVRVKDSRAQRPSKTVLKKTAATSLKTPAPDLLSFRPILVRDYQTAPSEGQSLQ